MMLRLPPDDAPAEAFSFSIFSDVIEGWFRRFATAAESLMIIA